MLHRATGSAKMVEAAARRNAASIAVGTAEFLVARCEELKLGDPPA